MKNFISNLTQFFGNKEESEQNFHNEKVEDSTTSVKSMVCGVSPDRIESLAEDEIFVFGSNLAGMHGGGAARIAYNKFGAVWGQGVGLQGQSYAIPTMQGGVETIRPYVDEFVTFAKDNPQLKFLVTRIGCGIAGFKDEEIAPLFAGCLDSPNVYLPQSFIDCLQKQAEPAMPLYLKQKVYGQTQTLVDLLIEMNKERPIHSPEEGMERLMRFLEQLRTGGDEIAWNCSVRSLYSCCHDCFSDGKLDARLLREAISHKGIFYTEGIEGVYRNYVVEKVMKLVLYMNTFRHYTDGRQIAEDFMKVTGGVNHCGPQPNNYYFAFSSFVAESLERHINRFWNRFAPNGVLDNRLFRDFMIERHERGIRKYGLEAVIQRNFVADSCHTSFYSPTRGGAAPAYVKTPRGFVKACGDWFHYGLMPWDFESYLIVPMLEDNPDYVKAGCYFLPAHDDTLPVFWDDGRMIEFENEEEKRKFIREHRK